MDDAGLSLGATLASLGADARAAARALALAPASQKTSALERFAGALEARTASILEANAQDRADAKHLPEAMMDRLALDEGRIAALAAGVRAVAAQPDPVGCALDRWTRPNGLEITKVSTPIGVIAMIYEARPGVTADAAALCVRSGNAVILRPGSECRRTAIAIADAAKSGFAAAGLHPAAAQVVPTASRDAVGALLEGLGGAVDLLIPRGGKSLVSRVRAEARVAVLSHDDGINHTFVHAGATLEMARRVVVNAKMRRVSVCGATETLLIDAAAAAFLPTIAADLIAAGCALRGDDRAQALIEGLVLATEADWETEYLAPILSVKIVDGLEGALEHIARYGSGHTEAIVTEDQAAADAFLARVDAAIVLVNASTQFADGGEFGFGAEIGIATGRLHARGPVGAQHLTTFKYVVRGSGQTRP
jgi:glutamate-5-semialdehyde dehydrogenase